MKDEEDFKASSDLLSPSDPRYQEMSDTVATLRQEMHQEKVNTRRKWYAIFKSIGLGAIFIFILSVSYMGIQGASLKQTLESGVTVLLYTVGFVALICGPRWALSFLEDLVIGGVIHAIHIVGRKRK